MAVRKSDEPMAAPAGLPRNLLVPYVLLFLKNWSAHGYQILQTLAMLGFAAVDPASVYRALRHMEREGLVLSNWQTGVSGPARRTYQLMPDGIDWLHAWAGALRESHRYLSIYLGRYDRIMERAAEQPAVQATSDSIA